jgi:prepilin-type processing-associated H-X9-DG protein
VQGLAEYYSTGIGRPADCNTQDEPELAPRVIAIYPEYLSDYNVLICPSAPDAGETAEDNLSIISEGCPFAGMADNPSDSYHYVGWVIDRCDGDDPMGTIMPDLPDQLLSGLLLIADTDLVPTGSNAFGDSNLTPAAGAACREQLDGDLSASAPNGNGGGETIYRLREGIERFLITDINNPAGSAVAQSKVAIMWDSINTNIGGGAAFNHVPGGSNVLFMDGHVSWVRFSTDGKFPVNAGYAGLVGLVDG